MFHLESKFKPTGDQPEAIKQLVAGLNKGERFLTLLGVTGSGKTFTMASVIRRLNRPALVISPNKVLAAQLYQEFSSFFPYNSVNFFVSYYDYYQPEAYLPTTDTYISKDARINDYLDQLRHSAIQAALTRRDFVIVSSVSCLYGIGDPSEYERVGFSLKVDEHIDFKTLTEQLRILQYIKRGQELKGGTYRFNKKEREIEIVMPDGQELLLITLNRSCLIEEIRRYLLRRNFEDKFRLSLADSNYQQLNEVKIYPAKFFVTPKDKLDLAILNIKQELEERYWQLLKEEKILEAERLKQRTLLDLELLERNGYCSGIENYSRHLSFRQPGEPPSTLLDYIPKDTVVFIDESHLALPQIKAMAYGDRQRKQALIEYGWRLPSAIDNRPLTFDEFFSKNFQTVFVSATPNEFERRHSAKVIEQLIRPTFITDPQIEVRPTDNQIVDLIREVQARINRNERVLILTITKRSAENLCEFLLSHNIKAHYLHADVKTLKRAEIIKKLRLGEIEALVGINLLREGLDLPEVSLVVILDADKEGFLRNTTTLIQSMGRASRHPEGRVILYADIVTNSMKQAIQETERRRQYQLEFNQRHNFQPTPIIREIQETLLDIGARKERLLTREELSLFLEQEQLNL